MKPERTRRAAVAAMAKPRRPVQMCIRDRPRADAGRRRPAVLLIIIASGQRAFKENGKSMFFYTRGIAQKIC